MRKEKKKNRKNGSLGTYRDFIFDILGTIRKISIKCL
jgi:hypothetical protein